MAFIMEFFLIVLPSKDPPKFNSFHENWPVLLNGIKVLRSIKVYVYNVLHTEQQPLLAFVLVLPSKTQDTFIPIRLPLLTSETGNVMDYDSEL